MATMCTAPISRLYRQVYSSADFQTSSAAPDAAEFSLVIEPDRLLRIASGPPIGIGSNLKLSNGNHDVYMKHLEINDHALIAKDGAGKEVKGEGVTVVVVDSGAGRANSRTA